MDTSIDSYEKVRALSDAICRPLETEDYVVQPRVEVSPPKWHLAHVTWFFENFLLKDIDPNYHVFDESFHELFNSYYKSQGTHWIQAERGQLSRPTVNQVYAYRRHVDEAVKDIFSTMDAQQREIFETGLHHEQQHQELLLMDIKAILAANPSMPAYIDRSVKSCTSLTLEFIEFDGGITPFGVNPEDGFSFCNETPGHQRLVEKFALANRPVSNGEFLQFIEKGGYENPWHWKSDGWTWVNENGIRAPLYWQQNGDQWNEFTLYGLQALDPNAPVCHLSWYEADAYASWAEARLPTEFELELAYATHADHLSGFYSGEALAPEMYQEGDSPFYSLTGNLWEWSQSPYVSYPRYRRPTGAFGEYNQKFMANQMVLRGGCLGTPAEHFRNTYRNFFYPHQRWAFTGLRLARDTAC